MGAPLNEPSPSYVVSVMNLYHSSASVKAPAGQTPAESAGEASVKRMSVVHNEPAYSPVVISSIGVSILAKKPAPLKPSPSTKRMFSSQRYHKAGYF